MIQYVLLASSSEEPGEEIIPKSKAPQIIGDRPQKEEQRNYWQKVAKYR